MLKHGSFVSSCERAVCVRSPYSLFSHGGSQIVTALSQSLSLEETFETTTQINKVLKITESNGTFCKKFKFLINRFSSIFFAKHGKSLEKMIHQKGSRGHRMSKIVKSKKSYSNHHLPYHYSFYDLGRTSMHDMALEFACAERIS